MKLSSLCNRKNVLILCIIVILLYIISGFYNPLVLTRYDYPAPKFPKALTDTVLYISLIFTVRNSVMGNLI